MGTKNPVRRAEQVALEMRMQRSRFAITVPAPAVQPACDANEPTRRYFRASSRDMPSAFTPSECTYRSLMRSKSSVCY